MLSPTSRCARCAEPLPLDAQTCGVCQRRPPAFDRTRVACDYTSVAQLITAVKDRGQWMLTAPLANLWLSRWQHQLDHRPMALIPMPLHWTRLLTRGFNQSALLSRHLADALHLPVFLKTIGRQRRTSSQRTLTRFQRRRNVRNAFSVQGKPPASVAIVDDVITTGATADAAARALKRAGCEHVEVWCIAKTSQFE